MRERLVVAAFGLGLGVFCGSGLLVGHHHPGLGLLVGVLAALTTSLLFWAALRHVALVRGLRRCSAPAQLAGIPVRTGQIGEAAFVAGLHRPTIYCDAALPERLTAAELRAVLLHERAHQVALDPARLLLLGLVAPVLRRFAWGRQWLAVAVARREIEADRYALSRGARRQDLASALLQLPAMTNAHVAGFTSAVDLRLQALLGDIQQVRAPLAVRSGMTFLGGSVAGAVLCTWLLHWWLSSSFGLLCC